MMTWVWTTEVHKKVTGVEPRKWCSVVNFMDVKSLHDGTKTSIRSQAFNLCLGGSRK